MVSDHSLSANVLPFPLESQQMFADFMQTAAAF